MQTAFAHATTGRTARRAALSRRVVAVGGLVAAASLVLTACSTSSTESPGGGTGKGTTITLSTYIDADVAKLLEKETQRFTEETGIKVIVQDLPGTGAAVYPGKLRTQLAGGKGPDLWQTWGGSLGEPYGSSGFAVDLAPYYDEYGWKKTIPEAAVAGMTWDGTTYGLPLYQAAVTAWYSKSAFKKAGIDAVPTTYDELLAANQKLVDAGEVPLGTAGKFGYHIMRLFEYLLEKNAGPDLHDKLLVGDADWNDPAVVKSFTELKDWADKGYLPKGVMGLEPAQEEPGFTTGKYAYTIVGGWADVTYVQPSKDPSDYGQFVLPTDQTPERHSGWVEGFMINKASPNPDAAAMLMNFLSTPESLKNAGISNPTVAEAAPDPDKFPLAAQNLEIAGNSPLYTIQDQAFPPEVSNGYYEVQSQVVQGKMTPQAAAKQMQTVVSNGLR